MFKAAELSQDLSVTKSCFECSIWILSVIHTASNNQTKSSNFEVYSGLLFTAWTSMFCHKWKELTFFHTDQQYKALEGEHTHN